MKQIKDIDEESHLIDNLCVLNVMITKLFPTERNDRLGKKRRKKSDIKMIFTMIYGGISLGCDGLKSNISVKAKYFTRTR